jgi:acyl-CoA reductase-like NAD-dependent aldehyde dehydrogenase
VRGWFFGSQDLTEFAEKFSPVRIELKMFNGIFNRVVSQAFLTGVTHAHRVASEEIFGPALNLYM